MKKEITVEGCGFTLVWRCWRGQPSWYLHNQLTLLLANGHLSSRIAHDRIEETYWAARSMTANRIGDLYLTEEQGFTLEVLRDLGGGEILLGIRLTQSFGFRGKVISSGLSRFLGEIALKIHGREIPESNLITTPEWNPATSFESQFVTEFGGLRLGFAKSDKGLTAVASSVEAPGVFGRAFESPLSVWISILDTAIIQLALEENSSSHLCLVRVGAVEFELNRDDETFDALLYVGEECHITLGVESDKPYDDLRTFLSRIKTLLISRFGSSR